MTVKLLICGRRRRGQTLVEHRQHMLEKHGKLVVGYIAADPENSPRRYVQNHAFDGLYPGGANLPEVFNFGLDFVTEVWFPDLQELKASRETEFYLEQLKPDEFQMVDVATAQGFPCAEEMLTMPQTGSAAIKVFVIWHHDAPTTRAVLDAVGGLASGHSGYCRNTPVVPAPIAAIDEFWFGDEPAAIAFAIACRDVAAGMDRATPSGFCITIASEYVLHAGESVTGARKENS